jgi:ferredoxin
MGIEVSVDRGMCMGAGDCVFTAPAVFELDGDRKAVVRDAAAAEKEAILEAANGCPNFAITVIVDGVTLGP